MKYFNFSTLTLFLFLCFAQSIRIELQSACIMGTCSANGICIILWNIIEYILYMHTVYVSIMLVRTTRVSTRLVDTGT